MNKQVRQIKNSSNREHIFCCNFCGISNHESENCTENRDNGNNPFDEFGRKRDCKQCGSYNHLLSDCKHSEANGSNERGSNGRKFQCEHCSSYDHKTNSCGKIHSEKLGKNKRGITGKKISCNKCNSFNHTVEYCTGLKTNRKANDLSCDRCGSFLHLANKCRETKRTIRRVESSEHHEVQEAPRRIIRVVGCDKTEQIEAEKKMKERLIAKFRMVDPSFFGSMKTASEQGSSNDEESTKINSEETVECIPINCVYDEPDPAIFEDRDLRSDLGKVRSFKEINHTMHTIIVNTLTGQAEDVVSDFNIQITKKDLYGLTGQNWLNDNVMEFYMRMIEVRSRSPKFRQSGMPSVHCMSTYFFLNLIMRGYGALERWTKDVDIFGFDIILIPIHQEMHW